MDTITPILDKFADGTITRQSALRELIQVAGLHAFEAQERLNRLTRSRIEASTPAAALKPEPTILIPDSYTLEVTSVICACGHELRTSRVQAEFIHHGIHTRRYLDRSDVLYTGVEIKHSSRRDGTPFCEECVGAASRSRMVAPPPEAKKTTWSRGTRAVDPAAAPKSKGMDLDALALD